MQRTKLIQTITLATITCLSVSAAAVTLSVPDNPLWTSTGITLGICNQVTISATGSWDFGVGSFGPQGSPSDPAPYDRFSSVANHGELIGYIGPDPFQGHYGDGTFFPQATGYLTVGNGLSFTSPTAGLLWMGINDDAVSQNVGDNFGGLTAAITVVPEPSTLILLVIAGMVPLVIKSGGMRAPNASRLR